MTFLCNALSMYGIIIHLNISYCMYHSLEFLYQIHKTEKKNSSIKNIVMTN